MTDLQPIFVGKSERSIYLYPQMANRHGLSACATGTGKPYKGGKGWNTFRKRNYL